jgi:hypothetical protein
VVTLEYTNGGVVGPGAYLLVELLTGVSEAELAAHEGETVTVFGPSSQFNHAPPAPVVGVPVVGVPNSFLPISRLLPGVPNTEIPLAFPLQDQTYAYADGWACTNPLACLMSAGTFVRTLRRSANGGWGNLQPLPKQVVQTAYTDQSGRFSFPQAANISGTVRVTQGTQSVEAPILTTPNHPITDAALTIKLAETAPLAEIAAFGVERTTIVEGQSTTLRWAIDHADRVVSARIEPGGTGVTSSAGSLAVTPIETTTYTLTLTNIAGVPTTATTTVTVIPADRGTEAQTVAGIQFSATTGTAPLRIVVSGFPPAPTVDWGDGDFSTVATGQQSSVSHIYLQPGSFTVRQTVASLSGGATTDLATVTVRDPNEGDLAGQCRVTFDSVPEGSVVLPTGWTNLTPFDRSEGQQGSVNAQVSAAAAHGTGRGLLLNDQQSGTPATGVLRSFPASDQGSVSFDLKAVGPVPLVAQLSSDRGPVAVVYLANGKLYYQGVAANLFDLPSNQWTHLQINWDLANEETPISATFVDAAGVTQTLPATALSFPDNVGPISGLLLSTGGPTWAGTGGTVAIDTVVTPCADPLEALAPVALTTTTTNGITVVSPTDPRRPLTVAVTPAAGRGLNFGDGTQDGGPYHQYALPGTYTITSLGNAVGTVRVADRAGNVPPPPVLSAIVPT